MSSDIKKAEEMAKGGLLVRGCFDERSGHSPCFELRLLFCDHDGWTLLHGACSWRGHEGGWRGPPEFEKFPYVGLARAWEEGSLGDNPLAETFLIPSVAHFVRRQSEGAACTVVNHEDSQDPVGKLASALVFHFIGRLDALAEELAPKIEPKALRRRVHGVFSNLFYNLRKASDLRE